VASVLQASGRKHQTASYGWFLWAAYRTRIQATVWSQDMVMRRRLLDPLKHGYY